ncbi:hypothetical protein PIB30_039270 [Stylosanthes scabra]|uniref:Membrane-associated kinase regulator 6 n=1 Tax=Stylosanthes scabra TaxID=79078 RepID=A0ABU6WCE5_9FABA|nr:hypothetical protein [Stylosanthes scabra]
MESSLTTLASESFSYSWLSSSSSSSSCKSTSQNFNFDISLSSNSSPDSSCVLAHADELFSGGTIKPLYVLHPNNNNPTITSSSSSSNLREDPLSPISNVEIHHHHDGWFTRWKTRTLRNISRCIGRLNRKVGCSSEKSVRVIDIDDTDNKNKKKKERQVKRSSITVHPIVGSFHDAHHENSIYEAVLHCKRSLGSSSARQAGQEGTNGVREKSKAD